METIISISILLLLGIICMQDFRSRSISVLILAALAIFCFIRAVKESSFQTAIINFAFVMLFELFLVSLLKLYFFLKEKRFIPIIDTKIGKGDIAFMMSASFMLSPVLFMLLLLTSTFFALIIVIIKFTLSKSNQRAQDYAIPLAGIQSAVLIIFIIIAGIVVRLPLSTQLLQLFYLP